MITLIFSQQENSQTKHQNHKKCGKYSLIRLLISIEEQPHHNERPQNKEGSKNVCRQTLFWEWGGRTGRHTKKRYLQQSQ
jgi:hypothetical protein